MTREEADIYASQILGFPKIKANTFYLQSRNYRDSSGGIFRLYELAGDFGTFEDEPSQIKKDKKGRVGYIGDYIPFDKIITLMPYSGIESFRKILAGCRTSVYTPYLQYYYSNRISGDKILYGYKLPVGSSARCKGVRVFRQKSTETWQNYYEQPEDAVSSDSGENRDWKVLNNPCKIGEWKSEELKFEEPKQITSDDPQVTVGTIEGKGEDVIIPNLNSVLKIYGKNKSNAQIGTYDWYDRSTAVPTFKETRDLRYPDVSNGNRTLCGLFDSSDFFTIDAAYQPDTIQRFDPFIENGEITARIYLSTDGEISDSNLASSHTFRWVSVIASVSKNKYFPEVFYTMHTFEDSKSAMEVYNQKIAGPIYSGTNLSDEQIQRMSDYNTGREEFSAIWNKGIPLSGRYSDLSYFRGDWIMYPCGIDYVNSRKVHLESGKTYSIIVELDNVVGQPVVDTIQILRSKNMRGAMKIRI